ncbi:WD40/YVTN/BNR-like repeat-containing protein [Sinimarinibacterium thermocellulolyticum]|uniref:Sialidase n=1 Tax=Sinimarinibacterium thermocellulolyticum TaxID=3170016 RepID=A0ABV2ADC6_9GAMM
MNDSACATAQQQQVARVRLGWPALLVAALVVGGAVYSFSPRQPPVFPATQVHPDRLLVNDVDRSGERFVAVGEQGQILVADAAQGPWRTVPPATQRGSTLTRVRFIDQRLLIAVGHDGWILRSEDRGESWTEVAFAEGSDPLLGVSPLVGDRIFAFGAFGAMLVSEDRGLSWRPHELVVVSDTASDVPAAPAENVDPYADPFAAFEAAEFGGQKHLNGMTQAADGSLILVGERGLMLRSTDGGQTWTELPSVYDGSLFGVLSLPSQTLIVYGMRGHVYRSEDLGQTWTESQLPGGESLFGGGVDEKGRALLVGASGSLLRSDDDGRSFAQVAARTRSSLVAIEPLASGGWLTAGEAGLVIKQPQTATGDAS